MADVTFEMLGFLVLNQDFFIVKFTVAIPEKGILLENIKIVLKFAYQHQGLLCFFFFLPIFLII